MIATSLLALFASTCPTSHGIQDSGRVPITAPVEPAEDDVRALSITELFARMPTEPWIKAPGQWTLKSVPAEIQRRAEGGLMSSDDWRQALLLGDVIHTRTRWPTDEPLVVWIQEPSWLRHTRIKARSTDPEIGQVTADNVQPSWCGNCRVEEVDRQRTLRFEAMPRGTRHVDFEVLIDQRDHPESVSRDHDGKHNLWQGQLRILIETVDSFEQALPSSSKSEEGVAIHDSIHASWWRDSTVSTAYPPRLCISAGGSYASFPALRSLATSLDVELVHDGVAMARTNLVISRGNWNDRSKEMSGYQLFDAVPAETYASDADLRGWEIRFTGVTTGVLPIWEADRWWKGSFTIPLADALKAGEAR